ncbi:MAG: GatB/YqeY domain-containing protein [Gammaproteobacteria bacterium]|nr:GatB/YqeY domain-containing protein [Gammaproteobacteria bacterium]
MSDSVSSLKTRLNEDVKTALRAGEKRRLMVLRLILSAIKQREVDERIQLDDAQVLAVLDKMLKQRRDSLSQYQTAGRADLADQELFEIALVQSYMPAALSEMEIEAMIAEAIQTSAAASLKDLGKVMTLLKPKLQGCADLSQVSAKAKNRLEAKG